MSGNEITIPFICAHFKLVMEGKSASETKIGC